MVDNEKELPKGFRWGDLQPGIKDACDKIVRSESFLDLVDILNRHSNLDEVTMSILLKGVNHQGVYTCIIGNSPGNDHYIVIIQYGSGGGSNSSRGEINVL